MQKSILDFFSDTSAAPSCEPPLFVDLFCGIGGASLGAVDAGYKVVLAIDSDEKVLEVHRRNHPSCKHKCMKLSWGCNLALPSGANWHLHGSPPCTKVSKANQSRDEDERRDALDAVRWYVNLAIESGATSWSMEQVATPVVLDGLQNIKASTRKKFDFEIINFMNHGMHGALKTTSTS